MISGVNMPKKVAIRNKRLAMFHFSMIGILGLGLLSKFFWQFDFAVNVGCNSQLELAWDIEESLGMMENAREQGSELSNMCMALPARRNVTRTRWGQEFDEHAFCTRLCPLESVLTHDVWNQDGALCWANFKSFGLNRSYTALQFLESQGRGAATAITAKNQWFLDHARGQRINYREIVPQSSAAVLNINYSYSISYGAQWAWRTGASTTGTNEQARTLILDADGRPWGSIVPPGARISIRAGEIVALARSTGADFGRFDLEKMSNGAEIVAQATCYNTVRDVKNTLNERVKDIDLDASYQQPVCLITFVLSSRTYQSHSIFASAGVSQEVIVETTGLLVRAVVGVGNFRVLDFGKCLLEITSMIVLLSVPKIITSFVATRMLGPLSRVYRRVIIEPYDIEEATVTTMAVLTANTRLFRDMQERNEDGRPVLTLASIHKHLMEGLEGRLESVDEHEIACLSLFCYEAMAQKEPMETTDGFFSSVAQEFGLDMRKVFSGGQKQKEMLSHTKGITLDQFNQVRLDTEKVTFDSVSHLFDKDRKRTWLEVFFTPGGIVKALQRAGADQDSACFSFKDGVQSQEMIEPCGEVALGEELDGAAHSADSAPERQQHSASGRSRDAASAHVGEVDGMAVLHADEESFSMTATFAEAKASTFRDLRKHMDVLAERVEKMEAALFRSVVFPGARSDTLPWSSEATSHISPPQSREPAGGFPSETAESAEGMETKWALAVMESFGYLKDEPPLSQRPSREDRRSSQRSRRKAAAEKRGVASASDCQAAGGVQESHAQASQAPLRVALDENFELQAPDLRKMSRV